MDRFVVRDSVASDVPKLAERLRKDDSMEVTCTGISVKRALWRSFRRSLIARTALIDDEVAVMGGVSGAPLEGRGEIWLLTAEVVEKMPFSFVKQARRELVGALRIFPEVHGYVLASYTRACSFLRLLEFELEDPRPMTSDGPLFRRYSIGLR